ncbi:hypothetical protein DYB25_009791 [Aphanomyces astaci]|uniref:Band 7 domain-containing protein n=1 Tax=Aphanomyces astaci TaxID=112090 RepID=A0A397BE98_APHAT|nr:hypothetical protein DYB25_009791 [Aphanomyces astaci]
MDVLVALAGVLLALISQKPLHRIEEGSVGVYWRGGRLLNMTSAPGYHLQWPILTKHANVQGRIRRRLMATQAQRNVVKRAETDLRTAVLASETASSLSIIHMQKLYEQTLATQNISRIQTFLTKLSPQYLDYLRATAGQTNIRYYFGPNIPHKLLHSASDAIVTADPQVSGLPNGH